MQTDRVLIPLEGRGVLALRGADRRAFLQGLISNDIARLTPSAALHAALLSPQGKYLFDFLLYDRGETILLETEATAVEDLTRRLTLYRLRAAVEFEPLSWTVAAVMGGAEGELALGDLGGDTGGDTGADTGDVIALPDPRQRGLGWRLLGPAPAIEAAAVRLGLDPAPFAVWDRTRIGLGVPDGSRDLIAQKSILLESNFEDLNGVAFDKGCYVGQELTARTKFRGLVRKRLVPVRLLGEAPPPGTPIEADGREAGELRSACGDLALALLRLDQLGAADLRAAGVALRPEPPAWMRVDLPTAPDAGAVAGGAA